MKKNNLLFILIAAIITTLAGTAKADLVLGGDFSRTHFTYNKEARNFLEENYNNIGPVVGISVNGIGVEAYYKTFKEKDKNNVDSKINAYGADFVLRLPTNEYIDFVGSVGYAKYEFEGDFTGFTDDSLECHGPRFGLGMQLNLNRHIGLRAMYHYTSINSGIEYFDSINELSAGLRLSF